jgi:undecaprenyl-diphosphatase
MAPSYALAVPHTKSVSVVCDAAQAVAGATVLAAAWHRALEPDTASWERAVMLRINGLPEGLRAVWPVMQLGNFFAAPGLALAVDRATRDRHLAAAVGMAGLAGYVGSKLVKRRVQRPRPAGRHPEIVLREHASGLGFVSGHAAEAVAMATVLLPRLPVGWRWLPILASAVVCFGRVYVGAHLPLDVVGGAGLGAAIGGTTNVVLRWREARTT